MSVHLVLIEYQNHEEVERSVKRIQETAGAFISKLEVVNNSAKNENIHLLWNRSLARATTPFFAIMNPDTYPEPGWLQQMLDLFHSQPQLGAVGPSTDHCYNEQAGRHPEIVKYAQRSWVPQVLVPGFCTVFRTQPVKDLGGWREDFEFYGGDLDLVYRLQLAGWMTGWCVPAFVWHAWGGAAKKRGEVEYARLRRVGNEQLQVALQGYGGLPGQWVHLGGGKIERKVPDGAKEALLA